MSETTNIETRIQTPYRHNFSDDFVSILLTFLRNHKHDNREDFNSSWEEFIDVNDEEILKERKKLKENGYNGDFNEKIYKSARFYFLKKVIQECPKTNDNLKKRVLINNTSTTKQKKTYIRISECFKEYIDKHIITIIGDIDKPSDCYESFCKTHTDQIKLEINLLISKGFDSYKIPEKIKKTFKNRFFPLQKRGFRTEIN